MKNQQTKKIGPIRAAFLDWLGIPFELTNHDAVRGVFNPESASGQTVTHHRILTLSAVWACTRLISQAFAMLPLSMMERTPTGKRLAPTHPIHQVIHVQPNPSTAACTFWESCVAAMLLRGCAHVERMMVGQRVVGLKFLAPTRTQVTRYLDGRRRWIYLEDNGTRREIPESRIWTIPGYSLDGVNGVSAIQYGTNVFGSALAADNAAHGTWKRGLMPTVALTYPKILQPAQRTEAREMLENLSGAVNAGKPVVLEAETEIHEVGINPEDAQLLESRAFAVEEVCRWFGVDPTMVGHGEKASHWGTGLEQKLIGFLTFTMGPIIRKIEQAISLGLLAPAERGRFYAKANIEGLLRADSAGRGAFYSLMVNNGILTRDEIRELEDREPMGGNAAVLTVQSAMAPLDSIGNNAADQQVRSALLAWLREDEPAPSSAGTGGQP